MAIVALLAFACLFGAGPVVAPHAQNAQNPQNLEFRWVYVAQNLQVEANVPKVEDLMRRAKMAGYNGIVLADYKLSVLHQVPDYYFKNVAKVQATAKDLGIEIIPAIFGIGYSSGLLSRDPNLAEGMPVRDLEMVVRNGIGGIAPEEAVTVQNLDFEAAADNKMAGWGYQDDIGQTTFADRDVKHGGAQSLRMENMEKVHPGGGNCRVSQLFKVKPWRQYHVSVWMKTEGFQRPGDARIAVLTPQGKSVSFAELGLQSTQEWKQHHVVFNSQENTELRLYFGVWGGGKGRLWWDDGKVEPVAFLNVLRRGGCPLDVRLSDGTSLKETQDFEPVKDPKLGTVPWPGGFEVFHEQPALKPSSSRKDLEGKRLKTSYYHLATTLEDQVTICPSEPKTYELLKDEYQRVNKLLSPSSLFLSHDEIRVGNWCDACMKRNLTPGQQLADNVRKCIQIVKTGNPKARLFIWSDMFDPNHNARGDYYLVNGSWEGSWAGLSSDVVIVDWYFGARKQTLPFFEGRGHKQLLAEYYDGPVQNIRTWLDDAKNVKGVCGVMYTTWQQDYSQLEAFAKAAWGG